MTAMRGREEPAWYWGLVCVCVCGSYLGSVFQAAAPPAGQAHERVRVLQAQRDGVALIVHPQRARVAQRHVAVRVEPRLLAHAAHGVRAETGRASEGHTRRESMCVLSECGACITYIRAGELACVCICVCGMVNDKTRARNLSVEGGVDHTHEQPATHRCVVAQVMHLPISVDQEPGVDCGCTQ